MLSLIICSRTKEISLHFKENIQDTIGCEYELISIDNSDNQYSIFEAYNIGLEKSKNKLICFLHDDILMHTNDWGKTIIRIFEEDQNVGLIGVAGSKIKTKMPSAWWNCPEDQKAIHLIQHFKEQGVKENWSFGFENKTNVEAAAIDGVFIALKKDERIRFNDRMKGFHNYDLNISFEYKRFNYKIIITNEILIEHFSNGSMNKEWVDSTFKIHNLYKEILPIRTNNEFSVESLKVLEFENGIKYVNHSLNFKFKKNAILVWFNLFKMKPYSNSYIKFSKKLIRLILLRTFQY